MFLNESHAQLRVISVTVGASCWALTELHTIGRCNRLIDSERLCLIGHHRRREHFVNLCFRKMSILDKGLEVREMPC